MRVEVPSPQPATAELAALRAKTINVHNSRLVCWLMLATSVITVLIGFRMALNSFTEFVPYRGVSFIRVLNFVQRLFGGIGMMILCPSLWRWARTMGSCRATLDEHGVDFRLGTIKYPEELVMAWDDINSMTEQRDAGAAIFTINGKDGDYATYSATTFFRPRKLARLAADRAGIAVQRL